MALYVVSDVIHVFIGTKPEYVKMSPLLLRMDAAEVDYRLIDSGQHAELSSALREEFGLKSPDFSLATGRDITTVRQALIWSLRIAGRLASRSKLRREVFGGLGGVCVVHGDTPTTLLSTLLARRAGLAVAHVEAGLRTYSWFQPFPEEIVRVLVGRLAEVLFAPGPTAAANLRRSGVKGRIVEQAGNTVLETVRAASLAQVQPSLPERPGIPRLSEERPAAPAVVTMHRFENLRRKKRWKELIDLVETLAARMPVCWVLHGPTERLISQETRHRLTEAGATLVSLLPHSEFFAMLGEAPLVVTDGGSIQEECALLGVPTLIWRSHTDREDGLGSNAVLSRFDPAVVEEFLADPQAYRQSARIPKVSPSEQILDELAAWR